MGACAVLGITNQKENKVTANKMAEQTEQTQIQKVTTKDPKKVEAGKRLAEYNRRKREELAQMKVQKSVNKLIYNGAGAVAAIGVLGVISYYIYQSKTHKETPVNQPKETPVNKFDMD